MSLFGSDKGQFCHCFILSGLDIVAEERVNGNHSQAASEYLDIIIAMSNAKKTNDLTTLADLKDGQIAYIVSLLGHNINKRRLMALGIVRGKEIQLDTVAPMGDPRIYSILGYRLTLRNEDARNIIVQSS